MSAVDIVLLALILFGVISGYRQGFLMTLFSLAALVLGILGAFKLMGYAIVWLSSHFDISDNILPYAAFALVFVAIVIGVSLLGKILKFSIDKTFLGQVDQVAGAALGLIKSIFLLSVALWLLGMLGIDLPEKWSRNSWLRPYIEAFATRVTVWMADFIPFFRGIFR